MYLHSGTTKFISQLHYQIPWLEELFMPSTQCVDSRWNVMAHSDVREGKWRGNWWMEWVASTLHTTSEHGVSSITTTDPHTLAASSRLNWCPRRFKWTPPFRQKTKSGFCTCAITYQLASTLTLGSFTSSEFLFTHRLRPPFMITFPSHWCYKEFLESRYAQTVLVISSSVSAFRLCQNHSNVAHCSGHTAT